MRSIDIETDVFAAIWAHRREGEEDEDTILRRLLGLRIKQADSSSAKGKVVAQTSTSGRVLWRDDVQQALKSLGGEAHLKEIYQAVRNLRRNEGRSLPVNLEAIVRRELENNSSDAGAYAGRHDLFRTVHGLGNGVWALRKGEGR